MESKDTAWARLKIYLAEHEGTIDYRKAAKAVNGSSQLINSYFSKLMNQGYVIRTRRSYYRVIKPIPLDFTLTNDKCLFLKTAKEKRRLMLRP